MNSHLPTRKGSQLSLSIKIIDFLETYITWRVGEGRLSGLINNWLKGNFNFMVFAQISDSSWNTFANIS